MSIQCMLLSKRLKKICAGGLYITSQYIVKTLRKCIIKM